MPTSAFVRASLSTLGLLVALAACSSEDARGSFAIPVDPAVAPAQPEIDGRPVGRMVSESGVETDFFLGELLVSTDDRAKVDAFAARWGGAVVRSTESGGADAPAIHRVTLDPSRAVVGTILDELNAKTPDLRGAFRASSDDAAKLLAVALAEASALGLTVMPNFVLHQDDLIDGRTTEAPEGDDAYSPNAFDWPYMNRGSAQDIGVGAALQAMARAGVLQNKVRMMILDGGFAPNADFPRESRVVGAWNERNGGSCGGNPCPWHGTGVVSAAMGTLDDGKGAAGPAAPVASLIAVPIRADFFELIENLRRVVRGLEDAQIINISAGFELDVGWDVATKILCLGGCPSPSEIGHIVMSAIAASNRLVFASAGNAGRDIDGRSTPEGSTTMPCELASVVCVGGMGHDTTSLYLDDLGGSNFGTKADEDSVDIYGPFWTYIGADPDNTANFARLRSGTSYSSPFVAGVAALVWASNPSLSARQVWEIVRDTAHVGGVHDRGGHQRRVNAYGAVERALSGAAPAITLNVAAPTADLHRQWSVTAAVTDDGRPCGPRSCLLTWDPAPERTVGNTAYFRFSTVGERRVSVTAVDPFGQPTTASTNVNVVNSPPVVTLAAPSGGDAVPQGLAIQLLGSATDVNEGADPGPGPLQCRWTSSVVGDPFPATGCNLSRSFSTQGARTLTLSATDPQGETVTRTVSITVTAPPANFPPTVTNTTTLPAIDYNGGYKWETALPFSAIASDPESNTPITFEWRATSFRPNSSVVYASNVVLGTSASLTWTPSSTPSLLGDYGAFADACYDGQVVRISVRATDSLGNTSPPTTLPDFRVFRCTLD